MKIVCDKCGTIVDREKAIELGFHYPLSMWTKRDKYWYFCESCTDKLKAVLKKELGIGEPHADS